MANHVHTPTPPTVVTSRRIAVATALLALSGAAVARAERPGARMLHPDAELIALCAEFRASEAAYCALYDDADLHDDAATEDTPTRSCWR